MSDSAASAALAITPGDSWAFAQLSGDFNPLHVDAQAARRLQFGTTVCHGVHLVLLALDKAVGGQGLQIDRLTGVNAVFHGSVPTGTPLQWGVIDAGAQRLRLTGSANGRTLFTVKLQMQAEAASASLWPMPMEPAKVTPARDLDFPQGPPLPGGQVPVGLNPGLSRHLFPALSVAPEGPQLIAELAASTRVVGMECPGLHSIYAELRLERRARPEAGLAGAMRYQVQRADPRFRSVRMGVSGPVWHGVLDAFFRAPPVAQALLAELICHVPARRFAGQRALVVGGSRGLGELAVKLLLAGGAEVTLTYAGGQQDAQRICEEAVLAGCAARAWRLDLRAPLDAVLSSEITAAGFTHLYHFATPLIAKTPATGWSQALFDQFSRFYVHGLAELVRAAASGAAPAGTAQGLTLLYPSTVFLDTPAPGFAEYCAAKAAGEVAADHLMLSHGLRLHRPRLPRLQTDQNSSFLGVEGQAPLPVLLKILQDMHPGVPGQALAQRAVA